MAEKAKEVATADLDHGEMAALGRALLEGQGPAAVIPAAEPGDELVSLRLDDLIRDEHGEVVLFNDSGLRALALETDAPVIAQGAADPHVTASGEDVSGLRYMSFANGLTLYYQDSLDLVVRSEHG